MSKAVHLKIRVVRMRVSSRLLQPTERKMRKESTEARDVELMEERKEGPSICAIARSGQITWSDLSGAAGRRFVFLWPTDGSLGDRRHASECTVSYWVRRMSLSQVA